MERNKIESIFTPTVLSLYDGMSCGMIAFKELGIYVKEYYAYEIEKNAIKVSQHNFPEIVQCGDTFEGDYKQYEGIDWLIGGSPCTHWSIAKSKTRETVASGIGWDLFQQYVRALHEAKPKYFIYENNKSMSDEIRHSISEAFGFEPICINSALVSAQTRQRLYWCGIRQDDGTYKKADIEQPEDMGILLKDILELQFSKELSDNEMQYMVRTIKDGRNHFDFGYFQNGNKDKSQCLTANLHKGVPYNVLAQPVRLGAIENGGQGYRIYSVDGKSVSQNATSGGPGANTGLYAQPVCVAQRTRYEEDGTPYQHFEPNPNGKINAMTTVPKDNLIADPVRAMNYDLESVTDKDAGIIAMLDMPGQHEMLRRVYGENGKAPTLNTCGGGNREPKVFTNVECIAEFKGNKFKIYTVRNGMINVKGVDYPIKLADGEYVIRKLTPNECKRLQTVPDWYEFPVANTHIYKLLGNGWTVRVIMHLIKSMLEN